MKCAYVHALTKPLGSLVYVHVCHKKDIYFPGARLRKESEKKHVMIYMPQDALVRTT